MLCVLQVPLEHRCRTLQSRLQLRIVCIRNQRVLHRIDHLLVIRHFVIDIRAIERRSAQRLQMRLTLRRTLLQRCLRRASCRRYMQLRAQLSHRLVHRGVIVDHLLRKLPHLGIVRLLQRQLARVDINLVRRHHDPHNLWIRRRLRLASHRKCPQRQRQKRLRISHAHPPFGDKAVSRIP